MQVDGFYELLYVFTNNPNRNNIMMFRLLPYSGCKSIKSRAQKV